jgi:hypothetical protein
MEVNKFLVSGKLWKSFWIESWQIDTWRNERTKVVLLFSLSKRENRFAPQIANFHNSLFHLLPLSSFVFLCLPLFVHASIFSFCHFCYLSSFFFFTYFPIVYCICHNSTSYLTFSVFKIIYLHNFSCLFVWNWEMPWI